MCDSDKCDNLLFHVKVHANERYKRVSSEMPDVRWRVELVKLALNSFQL